MYFIWFLLLCTVGVILVGFIIALISVPEDEKLYYTPLYIVCSLLALVILSAFMAEQGKYTVPDGKVLVTENGEVFTKDVYHIYDRIPPSLISKTHTSDIIEVFVYSEDNERFLLDVKVEAIWDELSKSEVLTLYANSLRGGNNIQKVVDYFMENELEYEITIKAKECSSQIASYNMATSIGRCIEHFMNSDSDTIGFDSFKIETKVIYVNFPHIDNYYGNPRKCYIDEVESVCRKS